MADAPAKDPETGRFLSGNSGGGRPKGARSKLGENFLKALMDDFDKHGTFAIEQVRSERPQDYIKVIASVLPKEISGPDGDALPLAIEWHIVSQPED